LAFGNLKAFKNTFTLNALRVGQMVYIHSKVDFE